MNQMEIFKNPEFGTIRAVEIDGEPWLVGKDVALALGYKNPQEAIRNHVDAEDKGVSELLTPGGMQNLPIINESGLYSLVLSSKLPQAKEFKRWVTSEVLPAIRKYGAYMNEQTLERALTSPDFLIQLATQLKEEQEKRRKLESENETMKPKALFADAVQTSKDSILIGQLAKMIRQNGHPIGQNRLFRKLREEGYLCSRGSDYNMPSQKSMEMGLMEIKERTVNNPDGSVRTTRTPKITGKGQIYFMNRYL